MFDWIYSNLTTVIVIAVILIAVVLAVFVIVRDKKKGSCSCGRACSGCAMSEYCHKKR